MRIIGLFSVAVESDLQRRDHHLQEPNILSRKMTSVWVNLPSRFHRRSTCTLSLVVECIQCQWRVQFSATVLALWRS